MNAKTIDSINARIEKFSYDEYDNDFYDKKDTIAMQGIDGNWYPFEQVKHYEKDFFIGTPRKMHMSAVMQPIPRPAEGGGFQMENTPAMPIPPNAPTILPPSQVKPVAKKPTDQSLSSADQFDITITKTIIGAGIAADLPFILFSPVFRDSNYSTLIPSLPAGVLLTVSDVGNGDVEFLFTLGVDGVSLVVSSTTTPYRSILSALMTDRFRVVKTRETISDNTILSQVSLPLNVSNGSLFGGQAFNKLSAVAQKGPDQFQNGIIDFDNEYPLDKYRAVQGFIANSAPDQFSTTFSLWATHVIKY